jgi:pyruvate/2-oxoglutarate dehydrogenase complex dihydrolipoamide acyltransferase (E2) component
VYVSDKNFVERHLDGEPAEPEPRQTNQRRDTITFPFGHGLVNVNHLVREMVDRRAPIPLDAPQRVQHLRKLVGKGAERTATELTSNELNELEHIFATAGLSDPHGVTRHEWESLYLIAFENAQGKPAWTPWALCSNPKAEVLRQRVAIEKSFRATLAESPTLDLAGNVAPNFDSGGYLLIDEARTRLGRLGFALEDESGEDVSIEQTPAQPAPAPANEASAQAQPEAQHKDETPPQKRQRWLTEFDSCGVLQRVYELEIQRNPRADRSYIGKQIKKARQERTAKGQHQTGAEKATTNAPAHPFGMLLPTKKKP